MKTKYVFIIGRKFDGELDMPRLSQCYATKEYAEIALKELQDKYPSA